MFPVTHWDISWSYVWVLVAADNLSSSFRMTSRYGILSRVPSPKFWDNPASTYPPKMTLPHPDAYLRYRVQPTLWLISALNNKKMIVNMFQWRLECHSVLIPSIKRTNCYRNVTTNLPNKDMYRYSLRIRVPCKISPILNINMQNSSSYKKYNFMDTLDPCIDKHVLYCMCSSPVRGKMYELILR